MSNDIDREIGHASFHSVLIKHMSVAVEACNKSDLFQLVFLSEHLIY